MVLSPKPHANEVATADCPFCPGNESAAPHELWRGNGGNGEWVTRVVANRVPLLEVGYDLDRSGVGIYDTMGGLGAHEVIVETPEHELAMSQMDVSGIQNVLFAYRGRLMDLSRDTRMKYIMIFKNQGIAAGALQQHAHSQPCRHPFSSL